MQPYLMDSLIGESRSNLRNNLPPMRSAFPFFFFLFLGGRVGPQSTMPPCCQIYEADLVCLETPGWTMASLDVIRVRRFNYNDMVSTYVLAESNKWLWSIRDPFFITMTKRYPIS